MVEFQSSSAQGGHGGVINIQAINCQVYINQCTFTGATAINDVRLNKQYEGSVLYSAYKDFSLLLQFSTITCINPYDYAVVLNAVNTGTSGIAGALYIANSISGVRTSTNTIKFCYNAFRGGAVSIVKTTLTDYNTYYHNNSAWIGGSLYSDFATLNIDTSAFYNNFAVHGGAIAIDNYIDATFKSTPLYQNNATNTGGSFMIIKSDFFNPVPASSVTFDTIESIYAS